MGGVSEVNTGHNNDDKDRIDIKRVGCNFVKSPPFLCEIRKEKVLSPYLVSIFFYLS